MPVEKMYNDIFIIFSTILIGVLVILIIKLIGYLQIKKKFINNEIECNKLVEENKNKTVEYSNNILEFIQSIITHIAMIKFKNFIDGNDISKITREKTKQLIQDVAIMTNSSINWENIIIIDTFLTKDFYETYIVEMSAMTIKQMLNTSLENNIE